MKDLRPRGVHIRGRNELAQSTSNVRLTRSPGPVPDKTELDFESLLEENLDALYHTALRLCGGGIDDAEDLMQDTVVKAWRNFGGLRERRAGRAWLYSILVRANLNRARTVKRRRELAFMDMSEQEFEASLADWSPMPDELVHMSDLRESMNEAVGSLHESLRTAVLLVDVEGFTQREAAEIMKVPEGTVASRLFRAHRALRDALQSHARDNLRGGGQ
jgi:RNA polymerase sigma-70 factor (ECF subfamily)